MSGIINRQNEKFVGDLVKFGTLRQLNQYDDNGVAFLDSVDIICDYDSLRILDRNGKYRGIALQVPGGPLVMAEVYSGYDKQKEDDLRERIAKQNARSIRLHFHYPCQTAQKFGHSLQEMALMIPDVRQKCIIGLGFERSNVRVYFHIKGFNFAKSIPSIRAYLFMPESGEGLYVAWSA